MIFFVFWRPCTYLKLCVFMDVFSPLTAEDKFSFISHSNQVILHGVTQQPGERADGHQPTHLLHKYIFTAITTQPVRQDILYRCYIIWNVRKKMSD